MACFRVVISVAWHIRRLATVKLLCFVRSQGPWFPCCRKEGRIRTRNAGSNISECEMRFLCKRFGFVLIVSFFFAQEGSNIATTGLAFTTKIQKTFSSKNALGI